MKRLWVMLTLVLSAAVQAKVWTVDNNPGNSAADFTNISTAIASGSVVNGDTIYVSGSSVQYTAGSVSKRLVFIGPGYFLGENPNTQANTQPAYTGYWDFNTGSSGSVVIGFYIQSYVIIDVPNITLKRNTIQANYSASLISINAANTILIQNYIVNTTTGGYEGVNVAASISGIVISNNYIECSGTGGQSVQGPAGVSYDLNHNVLKGETIMYGGTFDNNIILSGNLTISGVTPRNNITNSTQVTASNGNIPNSNVSAGGGIFPATGSTDGRWVAGGSAVNAGLDGTDIGMFGGASPYVLSGIPSIPTIYYFSGASSGSASQGLPVTIKVKSRN